MRRSAFTAEAVRDRRRRRQAGVTLVELMVAIAVALILSLSIVGVLTFSASSNKNATTLGTLNNNIRGVLTLMTRDANSAGFMLGAAQSQCQILLMYDANLSNSSPSSYPVWAQAQTHGGNLPFPASTTNSSGVTSTVTTTAYPAASSSNTTQVVLFTASPSVPQYLITSTTPPALLPGPIATAAYGDWSTTMSAGLLRLSTTAGITAGDTALLQVPMVGDPGLVCMRIPITSIGTGTITSTLGTTYMPVGGYTTFGGKIPSSFGTLGVGQLQHARLLDLGQSTTAMQIDEYWIDNSNGYPVLMRSVFNALNDQLIESDALAPGVVSLQALFGTTPTGSAVGTTPTFKTWSSVNQATDQVVSVALAVVTRTLYDDSSYNAPSSITVPQPATGLTAPNAFVNYSVSTAEVHRHFQVNTILISLRDSTWD